MPVLDAMMGGMSYLNQEREKEEERQRQAQLSTNQFMQKFLASNFERNTPEQNKASFQLMMDTSALPEPLKQRYSEQFNQSLTAADQYNPFPQEEFPLPSAPTMEESLTGTPKAPTGLTDFDEEMWRLQKQRMQPNMPLSVKQNLDEQIFELKKQAMMERAKVDVKRRDVLQGAHELAKAGATPEEMRDYTYTAWGGKYRPASGMFIGTNAPFQVIHPDGSTEDIFINTKTKEISDVNGNSKQLSPDDQISRMPFDRWMTTTDIYGNVRGVSPLRGTAHMIGPYGKPGVAISPEAQDALLAATGGDVTQAAGMAPGAYPKAQILNRAARMIPKTGMAPVPGTSMGPTPGAATPPVTNQSQAAGPTPFVSPKMTPAAQKMLQSVRFPLMELEKLLPELQEFSKGDPSTRLTPQALAYKLGFKTRASGLIADLNRAKVIGGTVYLQGGGTRAQGLVYQLQEHLSNPTIDETGLAIDKTVKAIQALKELENIVITTGGAGLTQQQALSQSAAGAMPGVPGAGQVPVRTQSDPNNPNRKRGFLADGSMVYSNDGGKSWQANQ